VLTKFTCRGKDRPQISEPDDVRKGKLKREKVAGPWWLTPIILATPEAEIRRFTVQSQPGQIVHESLSQKYLIQKGLVEWHKV
jgi:hypothetical protein